jgi:hypothetical protein
MPFRPDDIIFGRIAEQLGVKVWNPAEDRLPILTDHRVSAKVATGVRWLLTGVSLLEAEQECFDVLIIHRLLDIFESSFDVGNL